MSSDWRSADALRDGGVLMIDDVSSATRNGTAWNQRASALRRFRTVGRGWSCSLRMARIPMRGVNGRRRAGIRFPFPHDWGTFIRS